ncbi:MAG: sigma 54-interacting transcriptional regulator [Gammaproteobacteria bacterium]
MSSESRLLLVDDDLGLLRLLKIRLSAAGYTVDAVDSGHKAMARLETFQPQLVITDLRMDGMDGMAFFRLVHERHPTLPVILLTAHGTIPDAVQATQEGVFGYLTKPFDSKALLACVAKGLRMSGAVTADQTNGDDSWRRHIVTRSAAMEALLGRTRLVARTDTSVLIQGESGTGKELLARAIHASSPRAEKPFIAVNCNSIPETLLESELFGHRKGSFTGAVRTRRGLFFAADGGTLFLDEIGDMPLSFQAKLLRVLQEGEFRPVGSEQAETVDVRIISATHRDLDEAITAGQFRDDLYYRLHVVSLFMPRLGQRREDIPLLAAHFLTTIQGSGDPRVKAFSPEAMDLLVKAPWPGNVRQLRNVVEQSIALATTPIIPPSLVQSALRERPSEILSFAEARQHFEREYLVQLLRTTQGNVTRAAQLAKRERSKFYQLLRRHSLDPELFRKGFEL